MSVKEEKDYWDSAAADTAVLDKYIIDPSVSLQQCLDAILPELDQSITTSDCSVLEIGSGVGRLTAAVAGYYPGVKVCGIDISKKMIKLAEKNKVENVSFKQCDGRTIPYKDATFDAVYSMVVFQHVPTEAKESYIREAARVLVQGGVLRFQFVEDAEQGLVSHGISRDEVLLMCEYAGLQIDRIDTELIEPNWTWITCIKT